MPTDTLVHVPYPHPSPNIIVMALDHFYVLRVVDAASGDPLPTTELEAQLWAIAENAQRRGAAPDPVGLLSADDRDSWTVAREHLLSVSPVNRASCTAVEDALFVLSLDNYTLASAEYVSSSPSRDTPDLDAHIRNASSANGTGRNRWWDKAVGVHVEANGRASMVGEHSPCDALIPSIVCDYALAENLDAQQPSRRGAPVAEPPKPLEWVVDDVTREAIAKAGKTVEELAADSEGKMLWYDEYGAAWIKQVGASVLCVFRSLVVVVEKKGAPADSSFPRSQASSRPTRTSRWRSSSRTTRRTASRRRRTRRRRRGCSSTAAPT